jgi:methionyl aminopeptidase
MSIESPADVAGMRAAARVVRETLDALESRVRAGVTTARLDAVAKAIFEKRGARSAPAMVYGFPGHALISVNDEIVHGVPGPRVLNRGDIVKLDVTVEKDGYVADAARTVVVGRASDVAARLTACAATALRAGVEVARAGTKVNEIGRAVENEVRRHGFYVVRGLTGHGVGRTIHEAPDVPNWYEPRQKDVLTDGLVLTIEPMISAGPAHPVEDVNGWTIRTSDGSMAAHFEHTLIVTPGEAMVLT